MSRPHATIATALVQWNRVASKRRIVPVLALALAMSAGLPVAFAQAPASSAQTSQTQNAQPPAGTGTPAPGQAQAPAQRGMTNDMAGQGGMMGRGGTMGPGGMMRGTKGQSGSSGMGRMTMQGDDSGTTGDMMDQQDGMGMPFDHVEGRLAFLKTELKITPAQEPQWSKFADAYRSVAKTVRPRYQQMMQNDSATVPERLDRYEQQLTLRLEAVRDMKAAFDPLYTALSDEQKKTADELMGRRMGLM